MGTLLYWGCAAMKPLGCRAGAWGMSALWWLTVGVSGVPIVQVP